MVLGHGLYAGNAMIGEPNLNLTNGVGCRTEERGLYSFDWGALDFHIIDTLIRGTIAWV